MGLKFKFRTRMPGVRRWKALPPAIELGVKRGLVESAERIMTLAKKRTPVDLGNLKNSGHVQPPQRIGTALEIVFGFGGPAGAGNVGGETNKEPVGYAVYVHEDLTARHKVGQAKYLESALNDYRPKVSDIIARAVARTVRGSR